MSQHGMSGSNPAISGKIDAISNPIQRKLIAAIEKERVRQGFSMWGMDGTGAYNAAVSAGRNMQLKTFLTACDTLDIDIILINHEGEQI